MVNAIDDFLGGVCLITHHKEFAEATTRETWVVANYRCDVQGGPEWEKYAMEDHGMDEKEDVYMDASGNTHKMTQYKQILQNKITNGLALDEQEQG